MFQVAESFKAKAVNCHRSLTIWFNSIIGALIVGLPQLQDSLPQLQGYIPEDAYRQLTTLVLIGNMLLRFRTNKPLEEK